MIRPTFFFGLVLSLLLGLQVFNQFPMVWVDPFMPGNEQYLARLEALPPSRSAAYKLRHVLDSPDYDVMLFGNSVVLPVGERHLGKHGRVFNMAVPGSSLTSSASLALYLAEKEKLATTVIISAENFDYYTQQPQEFMLPFRWREVAVFLAAVAGSDVMPIRAKARLFARMAKKEIDHLQSALNAHIIYRHFQFALANILPQQSDPPRRLWKGYNSDGSGSGMVADVVEVKSLEPRAAQQSVLSSQVAFDLERIAKLRKRYRVIIYESPLEPTNRDFAEANPLPRPVMLRQVFAETCARLALECYPAPRIGVADEPNRWMDHWHPPETVLAPFLESLLTNAKTASHVVQ